MENLPKIVENGITFKTAFEPGEKHHTSLELNNSTDALKAIVEPTQVPTTFQYECSEDMKNTVPISEHVQQSPQFKENLSTEGDTLKEDNKDITNVPNDVPDSDILRKTRVSESTAFTSGILDMTSEEDNGNQVTDLNDETSDDTGDPSKDPGDNAVRTIDPDHLLPFRHGWRREVVMKTLRKSSAKHYDIFYLPPRNAPYRTRESKRKRFSKMDQQRYFEDFPHSQLSVQNFSYVPRPLGLNNTAYEILRKPGQINTEEVAEGRTLRGTLTPSKFGRRTLGSISYKEIEETAGLLESDSSDENDDEVRHINGFDMALPLSDQVNLNLPGMKLLHKQRRKYRDPETSCTPPLAEDMLWSALQDDPLGVYHSLGGRSSPTTPPPLRAVKLMPCKTAMKIADSFKDLKEEASKLVFCKEQELGDGYMASHDVAIRKYKNVKEQHYRLAFARNNMGEHLNVGLSTHHPQVSQCRPKTVSYLSHKRQNLLTTNPLIEPLSRILHPHQHSTTKSYDLLSRHDNVVKVKLPMAVVGKRPIVELVMKQGGKYQPIKLSNNMQVTEVISKRVFEQANSLRKTIYQRAKQLSDVRNQPIYLAVHPCQPVTEYALKRKLSYTSRSPKAQGRIKNSGDSSPKLMSEQVSILVKQKPIRPQSKSVLLNIPREVALKVKAGTTLSFSDSNAQKYVVINNKMHPPLKISGQSATPPRSSFVASPPSNQMINPLKRYSDRISSPKTSKYIQRNVQSTLPKGLSIQKVATPLAPCVGYLSRQQQSGVPRKTSGSSILGPSNKLPRTLTSSISSSGQILSSVNSVSVNPCTPYCPGINGFPELECTECKSLFHLKCVGLTQVSVAGVLTKWKCRMCSSSSSKAMLAIKKPPIPVQVIELD